MCKKYIDLLLFQNQELLFIKPCPLNFTNDNV